MSDLKGKCVGFDIGSLNLHFAVREGGRVTRVGLEPLPEGAVKKKGVRWIAAELKKKGVTDEMIETALSGLEGEDDAAKNALKRYLRGKDVTDKKVLQKAYANLLSKGFDYETARRALESLGEEDED